MILKKQKVLSIDNIELRLIYSRRRTIAISVRPDSTVILRVPYLTSMRSIERIVREKSEWIIKHRDNYINNPNLISAKKYINGESHLFRGINYLLKIESSKKSYLRINNEYIEIGVSRPDDPKAVKKMLYTFYKNQAQVVLPEMYRLTVFRFGNQDFKPTGLIIRTMKRRWGSCSNKGMITLSTELIKLSDRYIEYVIIHELCHLKHHNHGQRYYKLLSELYPDWKKVRQEMKIYVQ
jgi:predicted metal-dependent hydrolase